MNLKKYNITIWYISLVAQFLVLVISYLLVGDWINQYNSYFANFLVSLIPFLSVLIYPTFFYLYWVLIVICTFFLYKKNFNPYQMPKRFVVFNILFLMTGSIIGLICAISISLLMKNYQVKN